jgi:hypothetical protein
MNTVRSEDTRLISPIAAAVPVHVGAALQLATAPGECLLACAESTRMVGTELFERAYVALTDQRILVFSADDERGVRLAASDSLACCRIINQRELADGSMLVILGHAAGYRCLYFGTSWRAEAKAILEAVRVPYVMAASEPAEAYPDIDRFQLIQEFSGILRGIDESEDDDY